MADIVQVALRGSRKEFFLNSRNLWLKLRDEVIAQGEHGEMIGSVFLKDPTLIQLKRPGNVTHEIIRKATEEDLDQDDHNRAREQEAFEFCRDRIEARELKMDLSEVEVAFSGHRITFFFSAEHRVDFRDLVKDLAARFRCRIDLRQIGVRDQAKRLDGCGPCGRAFCCSTWLRDFHPVTLKMAREQQLSLNPGKISGACGRLMCCLAYELTQYRDSLEKLPPIGAELRTGQGVCTVFRTEIYQEAVWIRDDEGGEHRIAYADLPPGPYHKCGDCNCGKRSKPQNGGTPPEGEDPPAAWADPLGDPLE
ncbi:MAG TPA: regulatory iron-sulfur-containing complex subunit RicT [Candidatus Limnocylindria bacterium]|nr:regulatory iron-sulfur-containing complex subunit RicT [Candidatus Limnocylindria bacterium]